jgi:hypothetical protein
VDDDRVRDDQGQGDEERFHADLAEPALEQHGDGDEDWREHRGRPGEVEPIEDAASHEDAEHGRKLDGDRQGHERRLESEDGAHTPRSSART